MGGTMSTHTAAAAMVAKPVSTAIAKSDCSICDEIHEASKSSKRPKLTNTGWVMLGATGAFALAIYGVTMPFVMPGFRRVVLPYVPATQSQIDNILHCLKSRTGSCIDLGSGDGRILLAIAEKCRTKELSIDSVTGVELNPWLVWYSRYKSIRYKTPPQIKFERKDIFKTNLTHQDNIVVFGVEQLMIDLEEKIQKEMPEFGVVLACRFPFPNIEPDHVEGQGIDQVWVYTKPLRISKQDENV